MLYILPDSREFKGSEVLTFISIPLIGWGPVCASFPCPGHTAAAGERELSLPESALCPGGGTRQPQLAPSQSRGAYTLLTSFLRLMRKASVWTDFYISCGWVPQILKLSRKTQNIWCEHYANVYNHTVNVFYLEHTVLILFQISGNK